MKKFLLSMTLISSLAGAALAQTPERPPITGVAHAAFYCADLDATRDMLHDFFGFDESIRYNNPDGSTRLSAIKINERQIIELFPEKEAGSDRLFHYAIETTDAEGMRRYLKSKGYEVPDEVKKLDMGLINFFMTDPTGHRLEFVEYTGDGDLERTRGTHIPATRVSNRMSHLGFYVPDGDVAQDFFCNTLGFVTEWNREYRPGEMSGMLLRVPEGEGALELLVSTRPLTEKELLFVNHISMEVIDLPNALEILSGRTLPEGVAAPSAISVTEGGKRVINYALPDGTRFEIME